MANIINVNGIILKEVPYKESDKIITILTKEKGKISIYVHGAKKLDSIFFSVCQLYSYASFSIYENKGKYHLKEANLIESFYDLRNTLEGSALASYVAETSLDVTQEEQNEENILRLVLNSLYCISNSLKPLWQIKGTYEMRLCAEIGYMPDTHMCNRCNRVEFKDGFFNVTNGNILCPDCYHKSDVMLNDNSTINELEGIYLHPSLIIEITNPIAKAIDYITNSRLEKVFSFTLNDSEIELFKQVCEKFFLSHMDREYFSLDFYKSLWFM